MSNYVRSEQGAWWKGKGDEWEETRGGKGKGGKRERYPTCIFKFSLEYE